MRSIDGRERGPDSYSQKSDGSKNRPQCEAGHHFTAHDAPPITQPYFTERHSADHQRGRLRPRVASTGDDKRDKQRQNNGLLDLAFKEPHGRRRQHFSQEQDDEPTRPFFDHSRDATLADGSI